MKRVFVIVIVLLIWFIQCVSVQAKTVLTVSAKNVETKNNRLFDVEIYTGCTENLAATTFEITYDSNIMEYRSVDTDVTDGQVRAVDNKGKLKAIFLKSDGVGIDNNINLFSAKFKSINEGSSEVKIKIYDTVSNNAQELGYIAETECKVTVIGNTSDTAQQGNSEEKGESSKRKGDSELRGDNAEGKYKSGTDKKSSEDREKDNEGKKKKYLSVISEEIKGNEIYLLIIFVLAVFIGIMGVFGIRTIKNIEKKLNEKDMEKESSQQLATEEIKKKE